MPGVKPNLPLSLTMLSWGFNFVALKMVYEQMTPPAVALVRYLGMFALLVAFSASRKESLRYPQGETFRLLTLGFLSMGVYMVFFLEGMKESAPAEGAIILSTSPIFTALIASAVGQEKLNRGAFAGALLAFAGVAVVVLGASSGDHGKLLGNVLILISAVLWAASTVVSRPLVERISPFRVLTLSMPGALIVLVPYGLLASLHTPWTALTPTTWSMLAYVAVIAGAVGFVGFYEGVRQIGGPAAMVYQYFVPVLAALFAWLVLGRTVNGIQFVGMGIVLTGVGISNKARLAARFEGAGER
ncbi:MAG: DMT family transporter [Fimbriimonadaceae bacterium]|nr:DMT family transporter [Chthonomonadaceae bacterium]MCO5295288.1 DMT family transporter [Fimbriimonadaceae bacterium]